MELGAEDGPGVAAGETDAGRIEVGPPSPAVRAERVDLVLEDEEAGSLEEVEPLVIGQLQEPVELLALARRDGDQQSACDAAQLAQRGERAVRALLGG